MSNTLINTFVFGVAAFSPLDISGLELWLDADESDFSLTGSLVDQWDDVTSNGRDFTASGSARPTKTTVGGLEVISFDGTANTMGWTGTGFSLASGHTLVAVMAHKSLSSTGNTWFATSDGSGNDQDSGLRGRYEGNASSPDWAVRGSWDQVNRLNVSQDMGQATGTTLVWGLFRGDSGSASITGDNNYPTTATDTYTDEPADVEQMSIGDGLFSPDPRGAEAAINVRALLLYSQEVSGDDLTDLKTWLDDKIA